MTCQRQADEAFYAALADDDPVELYEKAPCGYLSTTPDGVIVKVNTTFTTWTGLHRTELVGRRRLAELFSMGGRIYHETHFAPMLRMQGRAREIAFDVVCADGRRLPVLVNAVLERDDLGEPRVIRVAVFDATERRSYERELLESKRRAEESERRARELAQVLQQTFVPPAPPHVEGLEVAAVYRPAGDGSEVGGDFYDCFQAGDGEWVVALGDVCGKGASAAVVTALVRHTVRALAGRLASPADVLRELNEVLLADSADRFCTLLLLRLRRTGSGWQARLVAGGHPLPLLLRPGREPVEAGRPGSLVGVLADPDLPESQVELGPGAALVLFTDGVTEARGEEGFFGREGLVEAAAPLRGDAEALAAGIVDQVLSFQQGVARDDIAVVALQVPPG